MAVSDLTKYYVSQIKSIVNNTERLALALLFVLFLVWRGPIRELYSKIEKGVTEKTIEDKYKEITKRSVTNLKLSSKKLQKKGNSYIPEGNDSYIEQWSSSVKNLQQEQEHFQKRITIAEKNRLSVLLAFDEIKNQSLIEFDIPTLRPLKEKARIGAIFWLALINFTLYRILVARRKVLSYIGKLYTTAFYIDKLKNTDCHELDLDLSFWIYPIRYKGALDSGVKEKLDCLLHFSKSRSKIFTSVIVIFLILIMIFDVFLVNWQLNKQIFFDDNPRSFIIVALTFVVLFLIQLVYWFAINNRILTKVSTISDGYDLVTNSFARRDVLKLIAPLSLYCVLFSRIEKLVPLTGPNMTEVLTRIRQRIRRNCIKDNPINQLSHGFYLNNKKVIHYVSPERVSMSLKNMPMTEKRGFFKNLKKLSSLNSIQPILKNVKLPFFEWVFVREIEFLIQKKMYAQAVATINIAVELAKHRNYTGALSISGLAKRLPTEFQGNVLTPNEDKVIEGTKMKVLGVS